MGQLSEWKRKLLETIAISIADCGFKRSLAHQAYYKTTDFGKWAFHLAFIFHQFDFDVTADVAIRFDKLEDLINETRSHLSEKEKKNFFHWS